VNQPQAPPEEADEAAEPVGPLPWFQRPLVSLAHAPFRLFWTSNLVFAIGMMVQFTARGWLTVQLTNSALILGLVEGVFGVTFALSSIPVGILADRRNRRNLLIAGDLVALVAVVLIGVLVATDAIEIWHVLVASAVGGVLFALRIPTGQAMTARLVPPAHIMNAISLNQIAHSLPNVAGPAAGGVLVAVVGIAGAYFVTTGAFVLGLMMMLGVAASFGSIDRANVKSVGEDLREAVNYVLAHRDLLSLTAAMLIPFILGQSYVLLLALFVDQELGLGPEAFGALSASLGLGAVVGGIAVATFGEERQIGLIMFVGIAATGMAAIVYGLSHSVFLTACVLFVAGAGQSALFAAYDTLLLIRLPDKMRGRVMGLMFTLVALFPIGAAIAGAIADQVGLRAVAIAEGVIIISMAAVAWRVVLSRASPGPDSVRHGAR
jgi:MFS family permease